MVIIAPYWLWQSRAIAAGVSFPLASLGRAVIRDYWQHGRDHAERVGEGAYLGADRHHAMMIALARQKPELATACFEAALTVGAADEEAMKAAVSRAEELYADNSIQRLSPAWYEHVYRLDGCVWALHGDVV